MKQTQRLRIWSLRHMRLLRLFLRSLRDKKYIGVACFVLDGKLGLSRLRGPFAIKR